MTDAPGTHPLPHSLFENISKRRWAGFIAAWSVILILFGLLYSHERNALIDEVRGHARGVASAAAAGIDPADHEQIRGREDSGSEAYRRIQKHLDKVFAQDRDVHYIYTMRPSRKPGALETDFEYVVDQTPYDRNRNGNLDPDEGWEAPGNPYDASGFPRLLEGLDRPSADDEVMADPPYPDVLSGYAPIKDAAGKTVGMVGVDISARTIADKLLETRIVVIYVAVLMCTLVALAVLLVYQQKEALQINQALREALGEKYEELQRVLQLREELSRMIVHDMRNHLTIIEMGCQLLEDKEHLDQDAAELIDQMNLEAQRLNAFINDLLMLAKMEDGKLVLKRSSVDLKRLVEETRERSAYIARSRHVRLNTEIPDTVKPVEADANLLQRVIDNLVNNALKFSPPDGTVVIRVADGAQQDARVRIEVTDEGPGIEAKYRERIFDRFQVIEVKKNVPQVGLGLAFCKMVVEAHQGRVFMTPNTPTGSVFTVEI
jgi:signal transduction histidine kinase